MSQDLRAKIEHELGEMMMGAENFFGAINPKRKGHIRCALDRIMDHLEKAGRVAPPNDEICPYKPPQGDLNQ